MTSLEHGFTDEDDMVQDSEDKEEGEMIRVKVELVPFGIEEEAKDIGELVLANTGDLGMGLCLYDSVFTSSDPTDADVMGTIPKLFDEILEELKSRNLDILYKLMGSN